MWYSYNERVLPLVRIPVPVPHWFEHLFQSSAKCQASSVKRQVSSVKRQVSSAKHQASSVKGQVSRVKGQGPRAKGQVSSVKWPSPLIRSSTLYQRLMTVPQQGTNYPFHNRERTTCGSQDEAGTCAGPSPPKIRSSTQHQCFTTVPTKRNERSVAHRMKPEHVPPPSRCGCGWCSGSITAGPSCSAGRLVRLFRTAHRAPPS